MTSWSLVIDFSG